MAVMKPMHAASQMETKPAAGVSYAYQAGYGSFAFHPYIHPVISVDAVQRYIFTSNPANHILSKNKDQFL